MDFLNPFRATFEVPFIYKLLKKLYHAKKKEIVSKKSVILNPVFFNPRHKEYETRI